MLRNEQYAMAPALIKQIETEIDFVERLHDMAHHCPNVCFNSKLVNRFNQGLPDDTRLLVENNPRLLNDGPTYLLCVPVLPPSCRRESAGYKVVCGKCIVEAMDPVPIANHVRSLRNALRVSPATNLFAERITTDMTWSLALITRTLWKW